MAWGKCKNFFGANVNYNLNKNLYLLQGSELCQEDLWSKITVHDIEKAVNDKLSEKYTYKQVSKVYGIPIAVIYNRIKGRKIPINCVKNGRISVLSKECEQKNEG